MRQVATIISIWLCTSIVHAQTHKTFFLGHSLINFNVPNMVQKLSTAGSNIFSYQVNIGNGANLQYHYTNPTSGQGDRWDTTLDNGGFNHFIFTEAVPLQGHLTWSKTYRYADTLCTYAHTYNPNIEFYVYETWHCTKSGNGSTTGIGGAPCDWDPGSTVPWRTRLTADLSLWESIADSLATKFTSKVNVIPAGQALARLSDSIDAGKVPGLDSIEQLFTDDIHLSNTGNYFIACVMYSVIHGISPYGLPNQLTDPWGSLYTNHPTAVQALIMQEIAYNTVCNYAYANIACGPLSISNNTGVTTTQTQANTALPVAIYNLQGVLIYKGNNTEPEIKNIINNLPSSLYILNTNNKRAMVQSSIY